MDTAPRNLDPLIRQALKRIVDSSHPLRIFLFGSAARDAARGDSDLDFLVVVPEGTARLKTAQRLHREMRGLSAAVDLIVATPSDLEKHRDNIGLIYRTILREGKELYAA
jgi:predicted nucleotidyltransferase